MTNPVTLMKTKPLTQLRELIASALKSQTNLSKSFQTFFIETMELILTHTGRLNFTQINEVMAVLQAELAKAAEGNKAAAARARKATLELEKLGKEFRKQSIAELK